MQARCDAGLQLRVLARTRYESTQVMDALLSANRDSDRLIGVSRVMWLERYPLYECTLHTRECFDRLRWESWHRWRLYADKQRDGWLCRAYLFLIGRKTSFRGCALRQTEPCKNKDRPLYPPFVFTTAVQFICSSIILICLALDEHIQTIWLWRVWPP